MKALIILIVLNYIATNTSFTKEDVSFQGEYEVNNRLYIDKNKIITTEYVDLISSIPNYHIKDLLYSAFDFAAGNYRYKLGGKTVVPQQSIKKGYLDCTNFIYYLFERAGIPTEHATTFQMVDTGEKIRKKQKVNNTITKNFEYIPAIKNTKNSFMPKSGDILAFFDKARNRGHAVVVIDPKNCIAVNATAWVWVQVDNQDEEKNVLDRSKTGIFFQKVIKGECENGIWKSWDSHKNKFQVMLRHKYFIEN